MAGPDPLSLFHRLDASLDAGAGVADVDAREGEAARRVVEAIRSYSADFSHLKLAENPDDKAAGRPVPQDDPAYLLLLFPEALSVVMAQALKRTEESFERFLAQAEARTQAAVERLEQTAEPRFEAAAERAFERAGGVIRRHANDLKVLTDTLHAEMAEHTARVDHYKTTTRQMFERLGAGLMASAEARVREDAALTAKATVAELAPLLREIVREVLQEEKAAAKGGLFKR